MSFVTRVEDLGEGAMLPYSTTYKVTTGQVAPHLQQGTERAVRMLEVLQSWLPSGTLSHE